MTLPPSGKRGKLWAYLSGGFGLSISSMLGLIVPLRAHQLDIPISTIGLIISARALTEILVAVPVGTFIGRFGARSAYITGTALCAVVACAFALAEGAWLFLALNCAVGAGRALAWVASQTHISTGGTAQDRARDTGRFSFVSNASQMLGPVMIGTAAAGLGYGPAFYVVGACALGFTLVGMKLPRHDGAQSSDPVGLKSAALLFKLPRIRVAMLLSFVRLWVPSIWNPFFPLFLVAGGFSPSLAGAVVSSAAVVATLSNLTTSPLLKVMSGEILCMIALALSLVGLVMSPFAMDVPLVFLPAALVGIGNGLSLPILIVLVSEAVPPHQRGLALGTRNAVNSASSTIAPLGAAPLVAAMGIGGAFAVTTGLAGTVLAVAFALHRGWR